MRPISLFAVGFSLLLPFAAAAEPTKEEIARADALFRAAQALLQAGNTSEACAKFAESYALDPAPGAMLNLGVCHDKEGKTASAYRDLQQLVTTLGAPKTRDDRERLKLANETLARLEPRLTRTAFDLSALPAGATLKLDGASIEPSQSQPIDPGDHTIELAAPGKATKSVVWSVPPQPGTQTFKAPELEPAAGATAAQPPQPATPPLTAKSKRASEDWKRPAAYACGAVGVVAIGLGTYFGFNTLSKRDERDAHCVATVCDAQGIDLHNKAETSATISTVAFIGGFAVLGAGAYFLFTAPAPRKTATIRATPTLGGLSIDGAF